MSEVGEAAETGALPDYSAAQIMAAISKALDAQDMPAAAALVRLLAVKDPRSAQMILDTLEVLR